MWIWVWARRWPIFKPTEVRKPMEKSCWFGYLVRVALVWCVLSAALVSVGTFILFGISIPTLILSCYSLETCFYRGFRTIKILDRRQRWPRVGEAHIPKCTVKHKKHRNLTYIWIWILNLKNNCFLNTICIFFCFYSKTRQIYKQKFGESREVCMYLYVLYIWIHCEQLFWKNILWVVSTPCGSKLRPILHAVNEIKLLEHFRL